MYHKKSIAAVFLLPLCCAVAAAGEKFSLLPLSPAYTAYLQQRQAALKKTSSSASLAAHGKLGLGAVPFPIDLRKTAGRDITAYFKARKPERFVAKGKGASSTGSCCSTSDSSCNLNTCGYVTSVKDQGAFGTCWTFASLGSVESSLLYNGGSSYDFSEKNMAMKSGYTPNVACYGDGSYYESPCNPMDMGGTSAMATAYLSRWSGPVLESDDSYPSTYSDSETDDTSGLTIQKHLQDLVWLPETSSADDSTYISNMKAAIVAYGAGYLGFYVDFDSFGSNYTYYYTTDCSGGPYGVGTCTCPSGHDCGGHAVTVVGWDDTISGTNFGLTSSQNGAFICKNSWGTSVGNSGYFYVSYYDTSIGGETAFFDAVADNDNYSRIYSYDTMGWDATASSLWSGNIFTSVASAESITAVGFYTADTGVAYTVSVYTGVNSTPADGTLASTTSGTMGASGYHTVTLATPVTVTYGQKFGVAVSLSDSNSAISETMTDFASPSASSGRGFLSSDGSSWSDVYSSVDNSASVAVKAYGTGGETIGSNTDWMANVVAYPSPVRFSQGDKIYFHAIMTYAPSPEIYIYTVSGRLVRHLTESGGDIVSTTTEKYGVWDGRNSSGEKVASGVYIYVAKSAGSSKTGKFGVLW